jgi:hypothetical protein
MSEPSLVTPVAWAPGSLGLWKSLNCADGWHRCKAGSTGDMTTWGPHRVTLCPLSRGRVTVCGAAVQGDGVTLIIRVFRAACCAEGDLAHAWLWPWLPQQKQQGQLWGEWGFKEHCVSPFCHTPLPGPQGEPRPAMPRVPRGHRY